MSQDREQRIAALLLETGAAHGAYEERELNGVYDQNWPEWYAAYLIAHGLSDLVQAQVTADQLSQLLKQSDEAYKREQPGEGWPSYYARRIVARLM
jgi:hypothetical protein